MPLPRPWLQTVGPLYSNNGSILATFLRIDIPKLPHFDQYNFVLFTGAGHRPAVLVKGAMRASYWPAARRGHAVG